MNLIKIAGIIGTVGGALCTLLSAWADGKVIKTEIAEEVAKQLAKK